MTAPLPERARLFHIGPPKTGTTALQAAGAASRSTLLEHGVRYPGSRPSQRAAVASFLGRRVSWSGGGADEDVTPPPIGHWNELMTEIEADTERRIWFGHEFAAGANEAAARRLAAAIGPRIEVVITLRSFPAMLPSIWQELTKSGNTTSFEDWLREVLQRPPSARAKRRFLVRHQQGALVRRWARVVGPEHVTVVVLDPADPAFVFHAFEGLLDLPHGLLAGATSPDSANRGMSAAEVELMRRLNVGLRQHAFGWNDYHRLIGRGAALRMLTCRRPGPDEPKIQLPPWAAAQAEREAQRFAATIAASGVRVVGDLKRLTAPAKPGPAAPVTPDQVPTEVAVEALLGLASAATGRGHAFRAARPGSAGSAELPTGELARTLARRTVGAVRRRVRRR